MPRGRRLVAASTAFHIMSRGNNRQDVFHEREDKQRYCRLLNEYKEENKLSVYHYCLMDNHVHSIIWINEGGQLSRYLKQVNLSYFHYYRKKYGFNGHFWQDRFKDSRVDTDSYLLQCGKYIELNPVRAGIVESPEEYEFSSYRYYAFGEQDILITPNPVYLGLSESAEQRCKRYIDFVIDGDKINAEQLQRALFIGSEAFVKRLQEYYAIKNEKKHRGRPRKTENRTVP